MRCKYSWVEVSRRITSLSNIRKPDLSKYDKILKCKIKLTWKKKICLSDLKYRYERI